MLCPFDDFMIHQYPYPVSQMWTTDPRAFERIYFNIHDRSGEFVVLLGAGVHPNLGVMDGGVTALYSEEQYNLRLSRSFAGPDRANVAIGPMRFDVIEGLRVWRLVLSEHTHDLSFDLVFRARTAAYESGRMLNNDRHFTTMEQYHFVQSGRYDGWLRIGDKTWTSDGESFYGHRDRSWGVRGPSPNANLDTQPLNAGLHLWIPAQFEHKCVFVHYQEDDDGKQIHCSGAVLYEDGRVSAPFVRVEHNLTLRKESREHACSTLVAIQSDGGVVTLQSKQLLPTIWLSGMGYGTHGQFKGALSVEGERWRVDGAVGQTISRGIRTDQLAEIRSEDEIGHGIFEHLISPRHHRYGVPE